MKYYNDDHTLTEQEYEHRKMIELVEEQLYSLNNALATAKEMQEETEKQIKLMHIVKQVMTFKNVKRFAVTNGKGFDIEGDVVAIYISQFVSYSIKDVRDILVSYGFTEVTWNEFFRQQERNRMVETL